VQPVDVCAIWLVILHSFFNQLLHHAIVYAQLPIAALDTHWMQPTANVNVLLNVQTVKFKLIALVVLAKEIGQWTQTDNALLVDLPLLNVTPPEKN
jgi:hypothetical protein